MICASHKIREKPFFFVSHVRFSWRSLVSGTFSLSLSLPFSLLLSWKHTILRNVVTRRSSIIMAKTSRMPWKTFCHHLILHTGKCVRRWKFIIIVKLETISRCTGSFFLSFHNVKCAVSILLLLLLLLLPPQRIFHLSTITNECPEQ